MTNPQADQPSVTGKLAVFIVSMGIVVAWSNYLVQFPVQSEFAGLDLSQILTWAAFTYPIAFLVTDTVNRLYGAAKARRIVYFGFALGVFLSVLNSYNTEAGGFDLFSLRIAAASGTAFLTAQLIDVFVFDKLRTGAWWKAPLISSLAGSILDTALFFSLAFVGTGVPWVTLAAGDFVVKLLMMLCLLPAFRALMALYPKTQNA